MVEIGQAQHVLGRAAPGLLEPPISLSMAGTCSWVGSYRNPFLSRELSVNAERPPIQLSQTGAMWNGLYR